MTTNLQWDFFSKPTPGDSPFSPELFLALVQSAPAWRMTWSPPWKKGSGCDEMGQKWIPSARQLELKILCGACCFYVFKAKIDQNWGAESSESTNTAPGGED